MNIKNKFLTFNLRKIKMANAKTKTPVSDGNRYNITNNKKIKIGNL